MTDAAAIPVSGSIPLGAAPSAAGASPHDPPPPRTPAPPAAGPAAAPPSFGRQVLRSTFAGIGARAGLAWIVLVALLAVFAPLIASTHPLAMKVDGRWSSPWLANLSPVDVTLLVAFAAAVGLVPARRWSVRRRALAFLAVVAAAAVLAGLLRPVPSSIDYTQYRRALAEGRAEAAYYAPIRFSPADRLFGQERMDNVAPSAGHPMGTGADASDVAANMIYACRVALSIGFVSTGVAVALGIVMGGIMGYFGGWVDLLGMRVVEIFESVPTLLLLLAFVPTFQKAGPAALYVMMAVLGFLGSFGYAEFVRAEFLTLRKRDFVHAARAAGLPLRSILFRHILPNGLTPVIVNVSFGIAGAILTETALTFLGIGLKDEASWGNLLNQALGASGRFYWWLALYPGTAIFLTVFSYNLIGEASRDALDPRLVHNT
jgi:peptide/nickel transport system permease protein